MTEKFQEGEHALLHSVNGSCLVKLDGEMVKLKGRRGAVSTSRIIGAEVGSRLDIGSFRFKLLRPDIRDIQENLDRGPQIIVPKDSSLIVSGLGLRSGMRVLEGGAGSGALTTVLLNAVSPGGSVITYDINKDHIDIARRNVEKTSLMDHWHPKIGDMGSEIEEKDIDAVVLDVPSPELAVAGMSKVLREGGRFCSYVPTTNQMERVFGELVDIGFVNVEAMEIIQRPFSVKKGAVRPVHEILAHTGYLVFARWMGSL